MLITTEKKFRSIFRKYTQLIAKKEYGVDVKVRFGKSYSWLSYVCHPSTARFTKRRYIAWGCCDPEEKVIYFHSLLFLLSPDIIRKDLRSGYFCLILHEITHLKHIDHLNGFRNELTRLYKKYFPLKKIFDKEIKEVKIS